LDSASIGAWAWSAGGMILAVAIALGLLRLATAAYALVAPATAGVVPVLHVVGLAAAGTLGFALLLATPHADAFRLGRILDAEGPWAVGLGGFLRGFALPGPETLAALLHGLRRPQGIGDVLGWLAVSLVVAGLWLSFRLWRGRSRLRAMAALLVMALLGALLLHYAVNLFAWLAAQLGFWVFALLLLVFQRWRYAPRGAH
jgi:hypothetical protein